MANEMLWPGARPSDDCLAPNQRPRALLLFGGIEAVWSAVGLACGIGHAGDPRHVFQLFNVFFLLGCASGHDAGNAQECDEVDFFHSVCGE